MKCKDTMAFEWTLIFAFAAMLSWGIGDFLMQRTTRKIGNLQTLLWIGIIGSVGLLPFVWSDLHLLLVPQNMLLILGLGIVCFLSALFDLEALKQGKISVVDVVIEMELPVTIALAFIFLGESLTTAQAIIILFIISGIVLIATKSFSSIRARIEKGVLLALAAAVLFGGVNFLTGISAKQITPFIAVWGQWTFFTVLCIFIVLFREGPGKVIRAASSHKALIFCVGVIDTLAWVFYAFAVRANEISITTAITESYPAIALILGVWLNKERILAHQWIGAGLALACSVALSMTV